MTDWKHSLAEHIPFMLAATRLGEVSGKINTTRILESLIIAGITGGIVMYGVQQKLDTQMAELKAQMSDFKVRLAEERSEAISRTNKIEARIDAFHIQPSGMAEMAGRERIR